MTRFSQIVDRLKAEADEKYATKDNLEHFLVAVLKAIKSEIDKVEGCSFKPDRPEFANDNQYVSVGVLLSFPNEYKMESKRFVITLQMYEDGYKVGLNHYQSEVLVNESEQASNIFFKLLDETI